MKLFNTTKAFAWALSMGVIFSLSLSSCKKSGGGGGGNTGTAPTITAFTPTTGVTGTVVTITGTNFTAATAVKFGTAAAASYTVVDATTITAVVGTGATGEVSVTTASGTGTKAGFTYATPTTNNVYNKITSDPTLSNLKGGIDKGGLKPLLQNPANQFTLFAPTNAILTQFGLTLSSLSADINDLVIRYHTLPTKVLSAAIPADVPNFKVLTANEPQDSLFITKVSSINQIYVNGVNVDAANKDIAADNGVIHKLNGLLIPPASNVYDYVTDTTISTGLDSLSKAIKLVVTANPSLQTLLTSSTATVFAPTNAAFEQLLIALGTINPSIKQLSDVPVATLFSILKDHVVTGRNYFINAALASQGAGLNTLGGKVLKVTVQSPQTVYIGQGAGAPLSRPDITCFNGVVHKINGILLP